MLGAIIAWGIMEPTALMPDGEHAVSYGFTFLIGLLSGLFIGFMLGLAEAVSGLSPKDAVRAVISGALVGAAGGVLGLTFGNAIYNVMFQMAGAGALTQHLPSNIPTAARPASEPGFMSFFLLLIGRGAGWSLIGGFIGLSQGIAASSTKKMINGMIGGLIGGAIGGSVFEILVWISLSGAVYFPSAMIRFISFAITGGAIGLFIGFIEEIAKQAWLLRLVGNNEIGKEYSLYKQSTAIGRSESADIPVYIDPDVIERHAIVSVQGKRYFIEDLGSYAGTSINGNKIAAKESLRDGDIIMVGKARFMFRDKATARNLPQQQSYSGVSIPNSQHVCPFCGAIKDASGNCQCSVGTSPVQNVPQAQNMQQTVQQAPAPSPIYQPEPTNIPTGVSQGARLAATAGPSAGQTFVLKSGETQIGRDATKDIGLPTDTTVSRNHARIAQEVTCYVLYDLGSTNGTYVNGVKITRKELVNNDMVQIGSSKFKFEQ